jgi:hypothetical protein
MPRLYGLFVVLAVYLTLEFRIYLPAGAHSSLFSCSSVAMGKFTFLFVKDTVPVPVYSKMQ